MGAAKAENRQPIERYAEQLTQCVGLFEQVLRQDRTGSPELVAELFTQDAALAEAQEELLAFFDTTRAEFTAKGYPPVILDRHDRAVAEHSARFEELHALLSALRAGAGDPLERRNCLHLLETYFKLHPVTPPARHSSDDKPPFVYRAPVSHETDIAELGLTEDGIPIPPRAEGAPPPPPLPEAAPPGPADLAETIDVRFTPEILDLAARLENSPLQIFNWVRNEIEFDPYNGSRRGAAETLRLKAGNDMDQASLLIALLRASGHPARYATGKVEMSSQAVNTWLGVNDAATAGSILATAGMGGTSINDGDLVRAVRCDRVWVEAFVPYSNYRGADPADGEELWIRLDPAFKPHVVSLGIDPIEGTDFNPDTFLSNYFAAQDPMTVLDRFESDMAALLAARPEPVDIATNSLHQEIARLESPWLPAGLPNRILSRDSEFSEIPVNRRYGLRFLISGEGSTLDHSLSLPEAAGKQVTVSYRGATPADQTLIDEAGGLFEVAQPWIIEVVPELRIDGCLVATGNGGVTLGKIQSSQITFTTPFPEGEAATISNSLIAGNYEGHGIDTGRAVALDENPETACPEDTRGTFLHTLAMRYLQLNDQADRRSAALLQSVLWKGVSNAIVSQQLGVIYSGGTPLSFDFEGLFIDADRAGATSFSAHGNDLTYTYGRIRGAQSSQNENLIFELELGLESVSTIKILILADLIDVPLLTITPANAATLIPQLTHPVSTRNDIINLINSGRIVTIPRDPIRYIDWVGTGYIDLDPVNGRGGYIIDGGLAGGSTAKKKKKPTVCEAVTSIVVSPEAPGRIYSTCDTRTVTITVSLTGYDKDCEVTSSRVVRKRINPSTLQPGPQRFKFGSTGDCGCSIQTVTLTIKDGFATFTDADTPTRQSAGGLLEAAAASSQEVKCEVKEGPDTTMWSADGPISPSNRTGASVSFNARSADSPFLVNFPLMLTPPPVANISAEGVAEECGTSVRVMVFPSGKREQKLALAESRSKTVANAKDDLAAIRDILRYLQGIKEILSGLKTFAETVRSPIVPPEPDFEGSIFFNDVFKEVDKSNRVEYIVGFGVGAEASLKGEFSVGSEFLGIPPPLANVAIFFPYGGAVGTTISGELVFRRPAEWVKSKLVDRRIFAKFVFGIGVRASALANFVSISLAGSVTSEVAAAVNANVTADGELDIGAEAQLTIGQVTVDFQTSAGWGIWSSTEQWEVHPGFKYPSPDPLRLSVLKIKFPQ